MELKFRKLEASEIDARISTVKPHGIQILLYKDARVDQNILDETVGPTNWQRSHQSIDARLYCTVSIYDDEKKMWVAKQDVGTESYTEKEKGQASDSFKRACFNWGIGRELYTAPFIWIANGNCTIKGDKCYDKFSVPEIGYDDKGNINKLKVVNDSMNKVVFELGKHIASPKQDKPAKAPTKVNENGATYLRNLCVDTGTDLDKILVAYGVQKITDMSMTQYNDCCGILEDRKKKIIAKERG